MNPVIAATRTDNNDVQKHIFATYINLRYGMAVLSLLFPVILYVVGRFVHNIELQPSMSAYYHAIGNPDVSYGGVPMRSYFVGILFAIGAFLYLYKGFRKDENIALNIAGICAIGVALAPMHHESAPGVQSSDFSWHGTFAVTLFLCLAYVALRCAKNTLKYLPASSKMPRKWFERLYKIIGLWMIAAPAVALAMTVLVGDIGKYVFFAEAAGVWAFAAYWFAKSYEMRQSEVEKKVAEGRITAV